jgi:cbb3-type cytochrome oxidase maturation protein
VEIVYFLIPVSLIIVALAVGVFFWAVRSGQYDDLEGPAWRILFDDEPMPPGGMDGGDDPSRRASRSVSGNGRSPK